MVMKQYDVFISHASEDKDSFVRPLTKCLEEHHLHIWYDEFSLKLGDSLRRSIDMGLTSSRYGVVILSHAFFAKHWAQRELDGLVARETIGRERVILPIWHGISKEHICEYSPPLADLVAVSSDKGLDHVVKEILRVVRPIGSPLIIARDQLIEFGLDPPVVTDEWWLDVVEASNRECSWGLFPQHEAWGRWTFPLPDGGSPEKRGERLAWIAMQMQWEKEANEQRICQITPPDEVLNFITSTPGLGEMCHQYTHFLATYAPQLTIPGFGGEFERDFNKLLQSSMSKYQQYHDEHSSFGSALTTTKLPPHCDKFIVLHHPHFGEYKAGSVACQFVQGDICGPSCKVYPIFDYAVWLLTSKSNWMPKSIREFLVQGIKEWAMWDWTDMVSKDEYDLGIELYQGMGVLARHLHKMSIHKCKTLGKTDMQDLRSRISISKKILHLSEELDCLVQAFLDARFIEEFLRQSARRQAKNKKKIPKKPTAKK
jgi:hypothetical protein